MGWYGFSPDSLLHTSLPVQILKKRFILTSVSPPPQSLCIVVLKWAPFHFWKVGEKKPSVYSMLFGRKDSSVIKRALRSCVLTSTVMNYPQRRTWGTRKTREKEIKIWSNSFVDLMAADLCSVMFCNVDVLANWEGAAGTSQHITAHIKERSVCVWGYIDR